MKCVIFGYPPDGIPSDTLLLELGVIHPLGAVQCTVDRFAITKPIWRLTRV